MAVQIIIDVTGDINADGRVALDVGGWDFAEVQLVTPTATATFETTNDAGGIQGVSDGSAVSATNYVAVQGTNVTSGSAVSTLAVSGLVKFNNLGQFLRIIGPGLTVSKAFVRLYKIN